MYPIHAGQIKAARAMLDWSQEDLAQIAGLSITTIRNLEMGYVPRGATTQVIRQAIENAGLEFIEPEGVRRRRNDVQIYQGSNSCDVFFEDMLNTVRDKGDEVLCVIKSQDMLARSCGAANVEQLKQLGEITTVKCLLSEAPNSSHVIPSFEFRITQYSSGLVSYYVYGDKYAVVLAEGNGAFRFIVFQSLSLSQSYRREFLVLWDKA